MNDPRIQFFTDSIESLESRLEQDNPSWDGLRAAIESALVEQFPKRCELRAFQAATVWEHRGSLGT